MNVAIIVCLGLSASFLVIGAVLLALSYRNFSRKLIENGRGRAEAEDRDDRVIWELGRGLPLVDAQPGGKIMTRRGFMPRFALGIFAALAGGSAARGWADTRLLGKTPGSAAQGSASPMETGANTLIAQQDHSDIESHGDDAHSDASGAGGLHYDIPHGDVNTHGDS